MLIGRGEERAEIDALLEDARRGRSRVLVLTGEAGIGKSALLDYARERAVGMRTLSVAGVESESDLPYGALHALLRPVLQSIAGLPERQRRALSAALALDASEEPDRLATYAGTLTLLDDVASERPLLVLLDDAHWLDRESAGAIAFVGRRVAGIDLAIVAAVRDGEPSRFGYESLPTRAIPPLSEGESLELLELRHGVTIEPGAARSLAAISAGNPLALIELPLTLSSDQLAGKEPLEEPLPVAARIEQAFLRRTESLSAEVQLSLLVVAAGAEVSLGSIRAAAAALGGESLETAESEGLIRVEADRVGVTHPLLRSAVYQAAPPGLRRRVHGALAAALADEPDQRAWQLAAAADGPDEETSAALEAAADRAVSRGGHAARARALERAADLSPDPVERARRMCAAAQAAFWAGDSMHAIALCERTLPLVQDPLIRADLVHQSVAVAGWHVGGFTATELEAEAARVEHLDADRAGKLFVLLFNQRWGSLEYRNGVAVSSRMERLLDRLGPWWRPRVLGSLAEARVAAGDAAGAHEHYDELVATDLVAAAAYVQSLVWVERYDDARRALAASLELGRSDGNVLRVAWSQGGSAILALALGNLTRARALASDALELTAALDVPFLIALNLVTLATIDAFQGREEACRARVAHALAKGCASTPWQTLPVCQSANGPQFLAR